MNILILGASGFIGNAIFHCLIKEHNITIACRKPIEGYNNWKEVDFLKKNDWNKLLDEIDLVINAIGIIEGDFDKIQAQAPIDLYSCCIKKGVKVVHISAIGAEKDNPTTHFLSSKKITDDFLLKYNKAKIIYPGIVIGRSGKSTQFFTEIAKLPIIPLLSEKPLSFIHIEQLADLVNNVVNNFDNYSNQTIAISKSEPIKDIFSALKGKKGKFIAIPEIFFKIFFGVFPGATIGIFNKSTFKLFQESEASDYKALYPEVSKKIDSNNIISGDTLPKLTALIAISFIWICSGVSSLISWDESYKLMQEIGANHQLSVLFIWLGSIADIFLGIAIFSKKYKKNIIKLQILTMLTYMIILSIGAPYYWIHPFGVLTKNIPLIALSYYLYKK